MDVFSDTKLNTLSISYHVRLKPNLHGLASADVGNRLLGMLLSWLRLFRIAGLTTIISNIIAVVVTTGLGSFDIVREIGQHFPNALWICAGSFFIYLSGMIWNDIADVERDAQIAPKRPLPSGRISFVNAWVVGLVCSILAVLCAAQVGWRGFYTATFVMCCALSYNFGAKHIPWLGASAWPSPVRAMPALPSCFWEMSISTSC